MLVDSEASVMTRSGQSLDGLVMEGGGGVPQSCRNYLPRRLWRVVLADLGL